MTHHTTRKLGVVMDPIGDLNYKKDSTLALLWAASDRDLELFYMEPADLFLDQGVPMGDMAPLEVFKDAQRWHNLGETQTRPLTELDAILMRRDPPFDIEYIYSTYILEAAEREGTLIVNRCQSLRDCNEKVFATQFPQCCPPVVVSADNERLKAFHSEHGDVIFKPLDGMGGAGIFRVGPDDPNLNVVLETLTRFGHSTIMGQRFIPEIKDGDKRVMVVDGEAIPWCLARVPPAGETRGNLAVGGKGTTQALTERDQWIVSQVAPTLREKGLLLAGLDVIGDYLTEINITSPTGLREIDAACDTDIGGRLIECIMKRLNTRA